MRGRPWNIRYDFGSAITLVNRERVIDRSTSIKDLRRRNLNEEEKRKKTHVFNIHAFIRTCVVRGNYDDKLHPSDELNFLVMRFFLSQMKCRSTGNIKLRKKHKQKPTIILARWGYGFPNCVFTWTILSIYSCCIQKRFKPKNWDRKRPFSLLFSQI